MSRPCEPPAPWCSISFGYSRGVCFTQQHATLLKKRIYAMYKKEMVEEGSKVYNRAAVAGAGGGDDGDDTPRPSGKAKGKAKAKPKARATGGAPEPIDDLSRELDEIARGEGDGDDDEGGDGGFEE